MAKFRQIRVTLGIRNSMYVSAHAASCSEIRLIFVVAEWQSRKLNYFFLLKRKNKYFICFQLNIIGSSSLVSRVDIINWFFRLYQLYSKSRRGYWHNILFNTVESHQSIWQFFLTKTLMGLTKLSRVLGPLCLVRVLLRLLTMIQAQRIGEDVRIRFLDFGMLQFCKNSLKHWY